MGHDKESGHRDTKSPDALIAKFSFLAILATAVAALFSVRTLDEMCICISNKLAWAWILFATAVLFAVIIMVWQNICCLKQKLYYALLIIAATAFMGGLVMLIVFTASVLNVI